MIQVLRQDTGIQNLYQFSVGAKDSEVCERVWNPKKCSSTMTRYSYLPAKKCKAIEFGGCLGNDNNFATPQECSNICTPGTLK